MRRGGITEQDFVIHDEVLLFSFFQSLCEGLGEAFKVFIGHACLGFDHRYCPNGPFGVRRVTLRPAKPHGCNRYRDADNENKEFVHIGVFLLFTAMRMLGLDFAPASSAETDLIAP